MDMQNIPAELYEVCKDSRDGLYYTVQEENNEKFLQALNPDGRGTKTDLKGFFNRELEIVGKEPDGCTVFFIGITEDLFGKIFYYESVLILNENRIYISYGAGHGRDHNYIKGKWK